MRAIILLSAAGFLSLVACGNNTPPASADTGGAMRQAIDAVAANAPANSQSLKPGQSVQGTIEADVGRGSQSFRSLSTKIAEDIGKQVDEKLASREGQRALDDANRTLSQSGIGQKADADQVRAIVASVAGKTLHDSDVRSVAILQSLLVSLKGTAADGSALDLGLQFDEASLTLSSANLSYRPDPKAMFELYQSAKDTRLDVDITRFEKNPDGSYAISGRFRAKDLPASKLAKKLAGTTLPHAEGSFDFTSLPLK